MEYRIVSYENKSYAMKCKHFNCNNETCKSKMWWRMTYKPKNKIIDVNAPIER